MKALFIKELQELSALIGFAVFVFALLMAAHLSVHIPLYTYKASLGYLIEDQLILCCLAAFAAGHGRFGHELEQGTLSFLEGLPISRTRIFVTKSAAVAVPVVGMWLAMLLTKAIALSLYPQPNAISLVPLLAAMSVQTGALLFLHATVGMALSWFGRVAWQAVMIVGLSMLIAQVILPWLIPYYPLFLGGVKVALRGGWPSIAWLPMLLWSMAGMGALVTAFVLFLGPGDRIVTGRGWVKWIAQCLIFGPVIGLMGLLILFSILGSAVQLPSLIERTERVETEHFRFLYARDDEESARQVIEAAEGIRLAIAASFDHDGPERIDVEITGASDHLQGVFIPGKIQLRPDGDEATLAHELAHAWSHSKSGGALQGQSKWGFYEEGLATHLEGLVSESTTHASPPNRGEPNSDWFLIPVSGRHQSRFNPDDRYPLGMAWVEAVIEVGGPKAMLCVHNRASEQADSTSDVIPWWTDVLTACDIDMGPFIEAYQSELPEPVVASKHPPFAYLGEATSNGIEVWPVVDSDAAQFACTARTDSSTPRTQYVTAFADRGEPCRLSTWLIRAEDFQLMVGEVKEDQSLAMGPWRDMRWEEVSPSRP